MLWFLPLVFLLSVAQPAYAEDGFAAEDCSSYPEVPVQVTPVFPDPAFDYRQNINQIRALSGDGQHNIREEIPLGLTHYQPILDVKVSTRMIDLPNGLTCARIDHVDVTLGYRDVTVYVASEIAPDSCGFNQVLDHEQKHIAVNRDVLARYAPLIEQQLEVYLRDNGVFREQNYGYAAQLAHDRMKNIVSDLAEQLSRENFERQRDIDTQQEYRRISLSCGGQLQTVAYRFLKTGL